MCLTSETSLGGEREAGRVVELSVLTYLWAFCISRICKSDFGLYSAVSKVSYTASVTIKKIAANNTAIALYHNYTHLQL